MFSHKRTLGAKDLDVPALGTAIQFSKCPFCSGSQCLVHNPSSSSKFGRNCQSSGLCILDRLSIVLLRSHFIQCSSWYLRPALCRPRTSRGLFKFRDCTCYAEFPCFGHAPSVGTSAECSFRDHRSFLRPFQEHVRPFRLWA